MRCILTLILIITGASIISAQISKPVSHTPFTSLLKKHVNDDGLINYAGFVKDSTILKRYLKLLCKTEPNNKFWTEDDIKAYWINVYNAHTIFLIVKNYPVKSIKDLNPEAEDPGNNIWQSRFIIIKGTPYSLDEIENRILRRDFNDPRIHFALCCASISCPVILKEAYEGKKINDQLEANTTRFINNEKENELKTDPIKISQIFNWYRDDFGGDRASVIKFINKYAKESIVPEAAVDFKEYDWGLNVQP
ncbi:MAG TPA: DUF547 domain-containing protein [Bacteroidetes bacterium]|nr:DUF547 domain-containing protein [Bacteroidota bacterium]